MGRSHLGRRNVGGCHLGRFRLGQRSVVERRVGVIDMTTTQANPGQLTSATTNGEKIMNQDRRECAPGASWI